MEKRTLASIIGVVVTVSIVVLAWILWDNPQKNAIKLAKKYTLALECITEKDNPLVMQKKMDSCYSLIKEKHDNYLKKYKDEDLSLYKSTFKITSDSLVNNANKLWSLSINKQLKKSLWYKDKETDYKNYLYLMRDDTLLFVNRSGVQKYKLVGNKITFDTATYTIEFKNLKEFCIDSTCFKMAIFKDSLIGEYGGMSYEEEYSYYLDFTYTKSKTYHIIFEPDLDFINLGNKYTYNIVGNDLMFGDLTKTKNKTVWFKNVNTLCFVGMNCNIFGRYKADYLDINSILK